MKLRSQNLFLGLIFAQAAHSIEEYWFRLYDVLTPARFISAMVSSNLALGFAIVNLALVSLGFWCYVARVRKRHPSGRTWAWFWTALEATNGAGHLILAASEGGYFPGAATAPLLLAFSVPLAVTLRQAGESER
jgi:hypothetical protein